MKGTPMKTNPTKPNCGQAASLATSERRERREPGFRRLSLRSLCSFVALLFPHLSGVSASAATRYVWQDSPSPGPPYTNWTTAAHVIQDAVDAALAGDEIVVTNGIYAIGGRAVGTNLLVNRVAVDKPLTVRSVNGPTNTIIQGYQVPGTTNGDSAIRCVYLGSGACLSGFTLTNGATGTNWADYPSVCGGGVWCESINVCVTNSVIVNNSACYGGGAYGGTLVNCSLTGNTASQNGGGAFGCTLHHCQMSGNSAVIGGGAYNATLHNCTLTGNAAGEGGGVCGGTLNNCTLKNNSASHYGGGACGFWDTPATLFNCTVSGNSAGDDGGGAYGSTINHCTLTGNSAIYGGGAFNGTLHNCVLTGNSAWHGGGAYGYVVFDMKGCLLNNCTLIGNSAYWGGGVSGGTPMGQGEVACNLNNCIVYSNTTPLVGGSEENYGPATLNYCCTTPTPAYGVGNITNAPCFVNAAAGDYRLLPNSPCIDAGTNLSGLITTDLLGLPRPMDGNGDGIARFDIGAYESNPYRFEPALQMSERGFLFTVSGEPGRSVRIERSRDLTNWQYAGEVPIPMGGQTLIDPAATSEPRLFYRAMRVP